MILNRAEVHRILQGNPNHACAQPKEVINLEKIPHVLTSSVAVLVQLSFIPIAALTSRLRQEWPPKANGFVRKKISRAP